MIAGQRRALIDDKTQNFAHQTKYSDGDVYRSMRLHELGNRPGSELRAREWLCQLSLCKQKIVKLLQKRSAIVKALDELLAFPGLWLGLKIGNIHKHLALHCDEQIVHYLEHIRDIWSKVMAGATPEALDTETVRCLQLRAPSVAADRKYIQHLFQRNRIFKRVTDPTARARLLTQVLALDTVIPSIETFHDSMKYFTIGARILRRYLVGDQEDAQCETTSLATLAWDSPTVPVIETGEGVFQPLVENERKTAFSALFLFALRHFPFLDNVPPLQDVKGEGMAAGPSETYVLHLCSRAKELGFRSAKINHALRLSPRIAPLMTDHVKSISGATAWKCGKPSIRTFRQLRSVAFLPTLDATDAEAGTTPAFILKYFMLAYFGASSYMMDVEPRDTGEPSMPAHGLPATWLGPGFDPSQYEGAGNKLQPQGLAGPRGEVRGTHSRVQKSRKAPGRRRKPHVPLPADHARGLDVGPPYRLAPRSPVFSPDHEDKLQAPLPPIQPDPAENTSSETTERAETVLPRRDVPPPTRPLATDMFQTPVDRQRKNLWKIRRRVGNGIKKSQKTSLEKQLDRTGKSKLPLSRFTFRSRTGKARPPSVEAPRHSPIFQLEDDRPRVRKLKRTQAESQEGDPWVDVRPAQGQHPGKRRRLRGPEARGVKRSISQAGEAWVTAIRAPAGPRPAKTRKSRHPPPSPQSQPAQGSDGLAATLEQEPAPRSMRHRRSLLEDPDDSPGNEAPEALVPTDGEVREGSVVDGGPLPISRQDTDAVTRPVLLENAHPSRNVRHEQGVMRRTHGRTRGIEGFAETKQDYPVGEDEDWPSDTELVQNDARRSAPASPDM